MTKRIWDLYAPVYEKAMSFEQKSYQAMIRRISKLVVDKDVLEVATGSGIIAKGIAMAANQVIATDYSEGMIGQAKKGDYPSNLRFEVADALALPYLDQAFDVVIISGALHIMDQPEKALQEIKRVLKPRGILIAPNFVVNQTGVKSKLWKRILKLAGIQLKNQWNAETYQEFLRENGWKVVNAKELTSRITIVYTECVKENRA